MVSALVLLFFGGDGCVPSLGPGTRRDEVDGVLSEVVGNEPVPDTLGLTFLPEARPKDLLPCPERALCPEAPFSPPLPRSRSRSLPLPYFNKAKTRVVISIREGKQH